MPVQDQLRLHPASPQYHSTNTKQSITLHSLVEVSQPVLPTFNPLDLREAINKSLLTTCSAKVVAIRRSHQGNLIFYASSDTAYLITVSKSWLHCLPFGEVRINNENEWKRKILYLSFQCHSPDTLNLELQNSNPTLHKAAPTQLLTPTVALVYFPDSTHPPEHLYVFTTYKELHEYQTRTLEEAKAAKRKAIERQKVSQSQERRVEQLEEEKKNAEGEGEMGVGWASEMEDDTMSPEG